MATAFAGAGAQVVNTTAGNKAATLAGATAGDMLVVVCCLTGAATAPSVTDDQSGTYTEVTGGSLKNTSADGLWVFVRTALVPATLSTVITMTSPGGDTGGGLLVYRLTGMSRVNSAAVRQFARQQNQAAAGTPAPVLGAAALTGNSLIGAVFNATNVATLTPPTGWTEKHDTGYNTPTSGVETATIDSGFTGTTVTWGSTSASAFAAVVVEMDASAAGSALTQNVNDSVTMSDATALGRGLTIGDTVTPADALAFDRAIVVADSVTPADALAFDRAMLLADSVAMSDGVTAARGLNQSVADSVTMSDALSREFGVNPADTLALADALVFDRGLSLADSLAIADSATPARGLVVTVGDSVTMSDAAPTFITGKGVTIDDTLAIADALSFDRAIVVADVVALADAVSFQRAINLADAVTMADAISRGFGVNPADALAIADALTFQRDVQITIADVLALVDQASPASGRQLVIADTVTLADLVDVLKLTPSGITAVYTRATRLSRGGRGSRARGGPGATSADGTSGESDTLEP